MKKNSLFTVIFSCVSCVLNYGNETEIAVSLYKNITVFVAVSLYTM